ncbi:hypothetical protein ACIRN4_23880 [Pimelobacter simplex]|uniref:hypothetical protein n=1 Tax=Nocardioides simplex TaxID=2045 RepID=UPI00381579F9
MGYQERKRAETRNRLSAGLRALAVEERARLDNASRRSALVASIRDDLGLVPFRVILRVVHGREDNTARRRSLVASIRDDLGLPETPESGEVVYGRPVSLDHHNALVASIATTHQLNRLPAYLREERRRHKINALVASGVPTSLAIRQTSPVRPNQGRKPLPTDAPPPGSTPAPRREVVRPTYGKNK